MRGCTGCFHLADLYATGDGVAQDFERAADLYREACWSRYAEACYAWGVLYQNGTGVDRRPAQGAALIRRACDLGYTEACPEDEEAGS